MHQYTIIELWLWRRLRDRPRSMGSRYASLSRDAGLQPKAAAAAQN